MGAKEKVGKYTLTLNMVSTDMAHTAKFYTSAYLTSLIFAIFIQKVYSLYTFFVHLSQGFTKGSYQLFHSTSSYA